MSDYRGMGPSIAEIADQLGARAEEFCRDRLPDGARTGNYWQCGDYGGGAGRSLVVRLTGPRRGKWTDYAASGREAFGDLIDIIELQDGVDKGEAVKRAKDWLGMPEREPVPTAERRTTEATSSPDSARKLFERGRSIEGTPAEAYLRGRGITEFGPALRFYPTCFYREKKGDPTRKVPALLCAITDVRGEVVGVNRIYLSEDGTPARVRDHKKVLGRIEGNAVRFGTPGDVLIVGEGVETMLAIKTALPHMPVHAALTAYHLSVYVPPRQVRSLWIARDAGRPGEDAANELERRMRGKRPNLRVQQLKPRRDDFNTRLRQMGPKRLARRLREIMGAEAEGTLPDTIDGHPSS